MNQAWDQTQKRLRKWQKNSGSAWELRRILSDSEFFKIIAMCAFKRVKVPPKHVGWQDWWGFYLERMVEREAMQLLLDSWNQDVWAHMNHQIRLTAHRIIEDVAEQSRLARAFALTLEGIVSTALGTLPASDSTRAQSYIQDQGEQSAGPVPDSGPSAC